MGNKNFKKVVTFGLLLMMLGVGFLGCPDNGCIDPPIKPKNVVAPRTIDPPIKPRV